MPSTDDPLLVYIAATQAVLGLTIEPAWLPSVRANLDVILKVGALVTGFVLPDDTEPAPVFEA